MSDHRELIVESARRAGEDMASRLAGVDPESGEKTVVDEKTKTVTAGAGE